MGVGSATDTVTSRSYVGEILAPTSREGDMVIMDKLPGHKNAAVIEMIESAGATAVFLPPYSPDLNPIEMMWSKVNSVLRKLAAWDSDSLSEAIGRALEQVTATGAIGWFAHCGYNFI